MRAVYHTLDSISNPTSQIAIEPARKRRCALSCCWLSSGGFASLQVCEKIAAMAHEISELLPAPSTVVFDLLHDYQRRLEWDTLLRAAYLEDGSVVAGKGVTSVCVGRRSLGGIPIRTIYVTFQRPTVAAVKMLNQPAFFGK
jgi:hypothetical protein